MLKETPLFFNHAGQRLFGVIHEPETKALNKAYVFCHAFAEEKLWSHRVYVSFARLLANRGYTILRFDYRGYGDSEGDFSDNTIESHIEDVYAAVSYMRNSFPDLKEIGLLGHRLGASIAILSYETLDISGPLMLWDPVIDGDRYINEFLRSNLTTQMAVYGEVKETREKLIKRMINNELINVEGYDLGKAQFDSIRSVKLNDITLSGSGSRLLIQVGRTEKPRKDFQSLAESVQADFRCVIEDPFWREIKRFYFRAEKISEASCSWLRGLE